MFAIVGLVSTLVWFGIALLGISKLDDLTDALRGSDETADDRVDPVEIAKERYARGEIDEEEFERIAGNVMGTDGGSRDPDRSEWATDRERETELE